MLAVVETPHRLANLSAFNFLTLNVGNCSTAEPQLPAPQEAALLKNDYLAELLDTVKSTVRLTTPMAIAVLHCAFSQGLTSSIHMTTCNGSGIA